MENLLRLLVVEDDLNDAEMMISTLKTGGFAVRPERAEDEEELQEKLKSHSPDVVICTIGSGSLTLEQVISSTRQMGRHVPVVAVATTPETDVVECLELGAHDMVRKDRPDHLRLAVKRAAGGQRQWRELKKFESALREAERRCKTLLDSSRDAIAYVHEGMHVYANVSYLDLFGFTNLDDVEGMPIMDLVSAKDQKALKDFLRGYEKGEGDDPAARLALELKTAGGEAFPAQMEFSIATIDGEPCTQILIRGQDEDAKDLQRQLNFLSQRDLVTGLYNRQYFMERLTAALGEATQGKGNASLVELRIDQFHHIRDQVGVAGADLVLSDVGKILETACEESDVVARFDGEAFAILLSRWESDELRTFLDGVLRAISDHICDVEGRSVTCTASIGVAQIDENGPSVNELLSRAQRACEEARQGHGNHVVIYQPKVGEMTQKQLDDIWNARISEAIRTDRLHLMFQPIVSLHGEGGERYDVFMRMLDAQGEMVSPSDFLPSAERSGMAKVLDRWVISHALDRLASQRRNGHETTFFIRITAGSFQEPSLLPWISEQLKERRIPAENVVFEMKETTAVSHLKLAREFVRGLKTLHCQFALDDFGSGLNPFQILQQIPADFLKIDPNFMGQLAKSSENQDAIRRMTDTAHSMNKLVIAQHVEDATALSILWGMGVNYIQGNFLQGPSGALDYDFSAMT